MVLVCTLNRKPSYILLSENIKKKNASKVPNILLMSLNENRSETHWMIRSYRGKFAISLLGYEKMKEISAIARGSYL